jgi:hypothetical protein
MHGKILAGAMAIAGAALAAPPASMRLDTFQGREAYILENGRIRVSLLRGGGHIGEIRFLSDDPRMAINPMYIPPKAGYMGHLLCFPWFGPPSAEERRLGLSFHGEAGGVDWQQNQPPKVDDHGVTFYYSAELEKTQYRVERAITLLTGEAVVYVEEWIENLANYDRPFNRNQHATFGPPFVAPGKNVLDLSGTKGFMDPRRAAGDTLPAGREFQWPNAVKPDGSMVSLREFQQAPKSTTFYSVLLDQSRPAGNFTMYNTDYPLLVGYLFPTADNPWIMDWQDNQRSGTQIARGIEFGTSPVDEGLRKSIERGSTFGMRGFGWIGARQRLKTTFTVFLAEIPAGFAGVQDVLQEPGRIVITERGSGRRIVVPSAR